MARLPLGVNLKPYTRRTKPKRASPGRRNWDDFVAVGSFWLGRVRISSRCSEDILEVPFSRQRDFLPGTGGGIPRVFHGIFLRLAWIAHRFAGSCHHRGHRL